jgi:hypothetical protein
VTEEIKQILLPVCLNVNAFMPNGNKRFYFSAGGGALFSGMTYKMDEGNGVTHSDKLAGIGSCVRLGLGYQWALCGHSALDVGLRGFWGSISRFTGTYTDASGEHDAAMTEDLDGLIGIHPKSEVGTNGLGYLKMGYTEMDARLCLTYHY